MPFYQRSGQIPPKRHSQFRQPDGSLYHEELFSTVGFAGVSSLLYHLRPPTQARSYRRLDPVVLAERDSEALRPHAFDMSALKSSGDPVSSRVPMLFNDTTVISAGTPDTSMAHFARNATADELVLVHEGAGVLLSTFGELRFGPQELILIPRGITVQWRLDPGPARFLTMESTDPIDVPTKLRNEHGQLLERSPYSERDIRVPVLTEPEDATGEFAVHVKHGQEVTEVIFDNHPFDVVGWDGYAYPYALRLSDVEPITGSLHQMPDNYQAFGSASAAICVIGPHKLDYHPLAIPAPPNHSSVDCDEVLYIVEGTVPGRNVSAGGQMTYHPRGITHGPKPGGYEASIGMEETDLTAFLIDTFAPLRLTTGADEVEDADYYRQWLPQ